MKRLLASCFGMGWLPFAPGSWGSLPSTIIFALMCHFKAPAISIFIAMAALAIVGCIICVKLTPFVIAATLQEDPPEVVVDELAGQAITFLLIPLLAPKAMATGQLWTTAVVGFLIFRAFDAIKPWPIYKLERLPKGWGVLADDLMASVYSAVMLLIFARLGWLEYLSEAVRFDGRLNIISAAILGAIQGLTEFLPISSSGHLVLLETFLKFNAATPQMLLFDLATHVGTVVVILIVFRKFIADLFKGLLTAGKSGTSPAAMYKENLSVRTLVLVIVVTIVTGVVGVIFKKYFLSARGSLAIVAAMWLVNGTLLLVAGRRKFVKGRLDLQQMGFLSAVIVGLAQAAAIMPGISRSGATICTAILIGLRRRLAVEFSFLIAIPAILGATAIELVGHSGELGSGNLPISAVLAGSAVAAAVGALALRLLIKVVEAGNLKFFGFYCYIPAGFVIIYLLR